MVSHVWVESCVQQEGVCDDGTVRQHAAAELQGCWVGDIARHMKLSYLSSLGHVTGTHLVLTMLVSRSCAVQSPALHM
jgi:hypothetical protein